jgi:hypothetical protein
VKADEKPGGARRHPHDASGHPAGEDAMTFTAVVAVGAMAGLHAALYGAYKDSPHESFLARRFVRELVVAAVVATGLAWFGSVDGQTPFIVYLSVFALSRIATEFWKLFLRVEPQGGFRIPTQVHLQRHVVDSPVCRQVLGLGWLSAIYGCYALFKLLPDSLPSVVAGAVAGAGIGLALACGGAYKDGTIEGFSWLKFAKSPTFAALGGVLAGLHTGSLPFLVLAAIGSERMLNELLFKVLRRGYVPGKFRSMTAAFPEWLERRRLFLAPYAATWVLYLVLVANVR